MAGAARQLRKGENTTLSDGVIEVSCRWQRLPGVDADLAALLLDAGQVRSDADFIFYNQAVSADGAVEHRGKRQHDSFIEDRISIELTGVPDDVDTVAVALSADGTAPLAALGPVDVEANDAATGSCLAHYAMADLTVETAAVVLHIYRRDGGWKLRAVGQGYHDGLAGLARDFGVDVEEPAPPPGPSVAGIDWTNPPIPAGYDTSR